MNLINWPVDDTRYQDTDEGGLYAYLVVPAYEGVSRDTGGCCVCTYAYLTRPDVCLSPEGIGIWDEEPELEEGDPSPLYDAREKLEQAGHKHAADKLANFLSYDTLSEALDVVIFLGATDRSLIIEETGTYFTATPDDLTPAGRTIYDTLAKGHVNSPVLLTFLDT
ncbi:hypothetical protein [Streptomyces sp. NPDC059278]|uniref:hypothetical protein n=1 Tax=Streptomyces sp. NPDC059278 TaxID=3346801 RepID=UPI0036C66432